MPWDLSMGTLIIILYVCPREHYMKVKNHTLRFTCALAASAQNWMITHYNDVIMGAIASQITSLTIVYSTVYSDADQRKHQSSASLAFVWGIHRGPVNSPHKWPVTLTMFPFDDVIMIAMPQNEMLYAAMDRCEVNPPVIVDSPHYETVMRRFDFFHVSLNKLLNEQANNQWFEISWRLYDVIAMTLHLKEPVIFNFIIGSEWKLYAKQNFFIYGCII